MIGRLVVLVEVEVQRGENPVNVRVVVIERERNLQFIGDLPLQGALILAPAVEPGLTSNAGLPGVGVGGSWDRVRSPG
jgi:hypothetical protein